MKPNTLLKFKFAQYKLRQIIMINEYIFEQLKCVALIIDNRLIKVVIVTIIRNLMYQIIQLLRSSINVIIKLTLKR